jgi:hypothetical protein
LLDPFVDTFQYPLTFTPNCIAFKKDHQLIDCIANRGLVESCTSYYGWHG